MLLFCWNLLSLRFPPLLRRWSRTVEIQARNCQLGEVEDAVLMLSKHPKSIGHWGSSFKRWFQKNENQQCVKPPVFGLGDQHHTDLAVQLTKRLTLLLRYLFSTIIISEKTESIQSAARPGSSFGRNSWAPFVLALLVVPVPPVKDLLVIGDFKRSDHRLLRILIYCDHILLHLWITFQNHRSNRVSGYVTAIGMPEH